MTVENTSQQHTTRKSAKNNGTDNRLWQISGQPIVAQPRGNNKLKQRNPKEPQLINKQKSKESKPDMQMSTVCPDKKHLICSFEVRRFRKGINSIFRDILPIVIRTGMVPKNLMEVGLEP